MRTETKSRPPTENASSENTLNDRGVTRFQYADSISSTCVMPSGACAIRATFPRAWARTAASFLLGTCLYPRDLRLANRAEVDFFFCFVCLRSALGADEGKHLPYRNRSTSTDSDDVYFLLLLPTMSAWISDNKTTGGNIYPSRRIFSKLFFWYWHEGMPRIEPRRLVLKKTHTQKKKKTAKCDRA